MAKSLPADAEHTGSPAALVHPEVGTPSRARLAVLGLGSGALFRLLPRIPDSIKRLLVGRRTVTIDGNTLDTTLQLMLAAQRASGAGGLIASSDVRDARAQLRRLASYLDTGISVGVRELSLPGPAGQLGARHYVPVNTVGDEPLLVFFHGGGFVVGDLDTHDGLCRLICRDAGVHVLSIDYRLAPEHPAPAGIEDCFAAYRWALEHRAELGAAESAKVAVGGDSAGANFATVVSKLARDAGVPTPALQLLIYPVADVADDTRSKTLFAEGYFLSKADMDFCTAHYLLGASIDRTDPRLSPLLADDLSGLPPAMVVTGGFDPLRDEGDKYAEALAAAGVAVDHRQFGAMVHGFANFFPLGGGSATAMAEIVSALRAHLARS